MARSVRKWRLTKTASNQLTRDLDGLKAIVEHSAERADQMDSMAKDAAQRGGERARLAGEYEQAAAAYRDVAKDVIARVDKLAQECMAASESANDAAGRIARRAAELRRSRRSR